MQISKPTVSLLSCYVISERRDLVGFRSCVDICLMSGSHYRTRHYLSFNGLRRFQSNDADIVVKHWSDWFVTLLSVGEQSLTPSSMYDSNSVNQDIAVFFVAICSRTFRICSSFFVSSIDFSGRSSSAVERSGRLALRKSPSAADLKTEPIKQEAFQLPPYRYRRNTARAEVLMGPVRITFWQFSQSQ